MAASSPQGGSHHLQESYTRILALSIRSLESGPTSSTHSIRVTLTYPGGTLSNSSQREIQLRLTNDCDPLFFFHLRINEQDYPTLKQNQGLLVDFNGFPAQLISLLDKCGDDKFLLVMNCGRDSTVLDIVESNPFKYLSHVSLVIQPGSDADVKTFLSQVTTDLKKENEALRVKFQHVHSSLESEITKFKSQLESKDSELHDLREELRSEASVNSEKYYRELSAEKEKLLNFQSDFTSKFEEEKLSLEKRHREVISALETKISNLTTTNRQLEQETYRSDSKIKEYENRLKCTEEDLKILNQELQMLRKLNSKLDGDYHEKQKVVGNLVKKLNSQEVELKEKLNLVARQQELISSLSEKGTHLEDKSQGLVRELEQTRVNLRNVGGDLIKANEIIRKLQEDGRQLGKKVKLQTQIISNQESQLNDKTEDLTQVRQNLQASNEKLTGLDRDLTQTKLRLEEIEGQVGAHEESIKSKDNMIAWLNKQLNEVQGLSNLNKFRQTMANSLNESRNPGQTQNTTEMPSWMNIYNSTIGSTSGNNNTLPNAPSNTANNNMQELTSALQNKAFVSGAGGIGDQPQPVLTQRSASGGDVVATTVPQKKVSPPVVALRPPTWAKTNKATLDHLLHRPPPTWRK